MPGDSFSGDFQFDLRQPEARWKVTWNELGKLSSHRIRQVRYLTGESSFAALVLAEIRTGVYAALMKWSGQMPDPTILTVEGTDVLYMSRDWGGNIPMVQTWTWTWSQDGPKLLDIAPVLREAIQRIAPGYSGYDDGFDWSDLHYQTWVWNGPWPGKIGVSDQIDAWFTFRDGRLTVKRVELRENFSETPTRRWPK
jgi:hypothetical protein